MLLRLLKPELVGLVCRKGQTLRLRFGVDAGGMHRE